MKRKWIIRLLAAFVAIAVLACLWVWLRPRNAEEQAIKYVEDYGWVYSNSYYSNFKEKKPLAGTVFLSVPMWKAAFHDADIKPDQKYWIFQFLLTENAFFMKLRAYVLMTAEKPERIVACRINAVDTGVRSEWAAAGYDISPYSYACVGAGDSRNYFLPDCPIEQIRESLWENLLYQ